MFEILSKNDFAFPACRAWWQNLEHSIEILYIISLVSLCSTARKGGSKGESLGALLGHFLPRSKKWHKSASTDQRAPKVRSMIVKRRSSIKIKLPLLPVKTSCYPRISP
jgi:hypothetical protein